MNVSRPLLLSLFGLVTACGGSIDSTDPISSACTGTESTAERLFLQQLSDTRAMIKWRGDADTLCYGTNADSLDQLVSASTTEGDHKEAVLANLSPATVYHYSLGGAATAADGQQFSTAPAAGELPADGNTRLLILGDSGTQTEGDHDGEAAEVLAGAATYIAATGNEAVDLLVALGDTAYETGTDEQWQGAFFDIYPDILKSSLAITTIGNHEMGFGSIELCLLVPGQVPCGVFQNIPGVSSSPDSDSYNGDGTTDADGNLVPDGTGMPYFDIFTIPTSAESGGVASGTEQYYSVDYGNVHVVSLDSQLSARDNTTRETMRQWLISDLSANTLDWTVVIFHHPPYTKGRNHDSDDTEVNEFDRPEWDIRNEFTPVFEEYGVDVVYSGHSHSYERSFYLRGHTGTSDTFDPAVHAELNAGGDPALGFGDDTYSQLSPTSGGIDDRVVYTVAGSAGKADSGGGATTTDEEWLRHAAHVPQPFDTECGSAEGCRRGLGLRGSVILDATESELTARFVDINGDVLDQFIITR